MKISKIVGVALFWGLQAFGYTIDPSLPKNVATQIQQDLTFMTTVKGEKASALHTQIFGQMDGDSYKNFFESRVTAIGHYHCGNPKATACVVPALAPSKMWITDNYIKFSQPQIARLMVLYHEARHTEKTHFNWAHARCPTPFVDSEGHDITSIWTGASLAGEPACDTTPLGSYGSSLILLKNISKFCANCTDKMMMDSGIFADDQFKRIIDSKAREQIKQDLY